jgi:hypothetical protein
MLDATYKFGVVLNFFCNRFEITQTDCVQRNVKDSCCKGSCVLTKELIKVDTDQNKVPVSIHVKSEPFSFLLPVSVNLPIQEALSPKLYFIYLSSFLDVMLDNPYVPPCMTAPKSA